MENTTTPGETPSVSLQIQKNLYIVELDGVTYNVFEYLNYDGDKSPVCRQVAIYILDDEEEIIDKELEQTIVKLLEEYGVREV